MLTENTVMTSSVIQLLLESNKRSNPWKYFGGKCSFVPNFPFYFSVHWISSHLQRHIPNGFSTNNTSSENSRCSWMCSYHRTSSSLQVRKTTRPWSGSGFMRARPSAAHPVVPTTSWWPTSSPTNFCWPVCYHTHAQHSCMGFFFFNFHIFLLPLGRGGHNARHRPSRFDSSAL